MVRWVFGSRGRSRVDDRLIARLRPATLCILITFRSRSITVSPEAASAAGALHVALVLVCCMQLDYPMGICIRKD